MIIGIVGKVGSGKSCAVKYIVENYGATAFSCDDIAKEMMNAKRNKYEQSEQIFTNENLQEQIRTEFHPKVFSRIFENISEQKPRISLIETALPSDEFMKKCDKVIFIDNSYEKKLELLSEHRGYTREKIDLILKSQEYYDQFYKKVDYVIENNGTKTEMFDRLKEVMDEICIICK